MTATAEKTEKTVKALVAPGRTVVGNSGAAVGPGKPVMVLESELALLVARGFVLDKTGNVQRSAPPAVQSAEG